MTASRACHVSSWLEVFLKMFFVDFLPIGGIETGLLFSFSLLSVEFFFFKDILKVGFSLCKLRESFFPFLGV